MLGRKQSVVGEHNLINPEYLEEVLIFPLLQDANLFSGGNRGGRE